MTDTTLPHDPVHKPSLPPQRIRISQPRVRHYQTGFYPPTSFWPRNKPFIVVGGIIAACCGTFAAQKWAVLRAEQLHDDRAAVFLSENAVCSTENVDAGRWWVRITSSFSHGNLIHLGFNMMALWSLGPPCVHVFGTSAFIGVYVTSQLSCAAASLYWERRREEIRKSNVGRRWDPWGQGQQLQQQRKWFAPKVDADATHQHTGAIGASGAIIGVTSAWMCFAPSTRTGLPLIPGSMPMWVFMAGLAAGSLYCLDSGDLPQLGHAGHLGGLIGGMASYYAYVRPFLRRVR